VQGSASTTTASGDVSKRIESNSVAATPSTMRGGSWIQRPVVILEALDKPELPERLRAVELLGHESTNQPAQLCLATRRAERGLADVVFEVKVRIIHPDRATEVERHAANRLAIARNPIKLAGNHVQQRP